MYWKYHIENGDAIVFKHKGKRVEGTVRGWLNVEQFEDETIDDVEPSDFKLSVRSGQETVTVNLEDVIESIDEDDRDTDLPFVSEHFRLTGGVEQV